MLQSKRNTGLLGQMVVSLLTVLAVCQGCDSRQAPRLDDLAKNDLAAEKSDRNRHEAWVDYSPVRELPSSPVDPWQVYDGTPLLISAAPPERADDLATSEPLVVRDLSAAKVPSSTASFASPPMTQVELENVPPARAFDVEDYDDAAQRAANTSLEEVLAYFPAEGELSQQLRPRVQQAFTLARNGALHAARDEFQQLLTDLATAKDASQMTSRHVRDLKAGLRALAEAEDFHDAGEQQIAPAKLAAGHQTPMLHESESEWVLPHEAIAMYHLYAQQKLAAAVAGEQAGSMLLFGLGKTYSHLAERDELLQAGHKSLTMYRAAVGAHSDNYLAANEAGVLLAKAGRYAKAASLLELAARTGGTSATHLNLAYVHHKLGNQRLAGQHQQAANRIAQLEIQRGQLSAERGIAWVSPDQFNRTSQQSTPAAVASRPAMPTTTTPAQAPRAASRPQPSTPSVWW